MSEQLELSVKQIISLNPEISYKQAISSYPYLKITKNGFCTAKYRNRQKIKTTVKTKITTGSKMTLLMKVLEIIKSTPDGATSKQISEALKIPKSSIYLKIHDLRKKFNIEKNVDKYVFKSENTNSVVVVEKPLETTKKQTPVFDDEIYKAINDIKSLPNSDRIDYLDMFKKKRFYELCLDALVKSNEVAESIKHTFLTM